MEGFFTFFSKYKYQRNFNWMNMNEKGLVFGYSPAEELACHTQSPWRLGLGARVFNLMVAADFFWWLIWSLVTSPSIFCRFAMNVFFFFAHQAWVVFPGPWQVRFRARPTDPCASWLWYCWFTGDEVPWRWKKSSRLDDVGWVGRTWEGKDLGDTSDTLIFWIDFEYQVVFLQRLLDPATWTSFFSKPETVLKPRGLTSISETHGDERALRWTWQKITYTDDTSDIPETHWNTRHRLRNVAKKGWVNLNQSSLISKWRGAHCFARGRWWLLLASPIASPVLVATPGVGMGGDVM